MGAQNLRRKSTKVSFITRTVASIVGSARSRRSQNSLCGCGCVHLMKRVFKPSAETELATTYISKSRSKYRSEQARPKEQTHSFQAHAPRQRPVSAPYLRIVRRARTRLQACISRPLAGRGKTKRSSEETSAKNKNRGILTANSCHTAGFTL